MRSTLPVRTLLLATLAVGSLILLPASASATNGRTAQSTAETASTSATKSGDPIPLTQAIEWMSNTHDIRFSYSPHEVDSLRIPSWSLSEFGVRNRAGQFRLLGELLFENGFAFQSADANPEQGHPIYRINRVQQVTQASAPVSRPSELPDDAYWGAMMVHLENAEVNSVQRALLNIATRPGGVVQPIQGVNALLIQDRRPNLESMYRLIQILDHQDPDADPDDEASSRSRRSVPNNATVSRGSRAGFVANRQPQRPDLGEIQSFQFDDMVTARSVHSMLNEALEYERAYGQIVIHSANNRVMYRATEAIEPLVPLIKDWALASTDGSDITSWSNEDADFSILAIPGRSRVEASTAYGTLRSLYPEVASIRMSVFELNGTLMVRVPNDNLDEIRTAFQTILAELAPQPEPADAPTDETETAEAPAEEATEAAPAE